MNKKMVKIVLSVLAVFIVAVLIILTVFVGSRGLGPFKFLKARRVKAAPGNAAEYHLENVEALERSPLAGKRILFLGSSVTKGTCSLGISMADYIAKLDDCEVVKEAVGRTTLSTAKDNSYIARLKALDPNQKFDMVVCQLSTNDASSKMELGEISDSKNIDDFDTMTVTGAMEHVIAYCQKTWECPVVFYTGTKYDSAEYQNMVDRLLELQNKWDIGVIDLWNNKEMNEVSDEDYDLYMFNSIHPTQAGYLKWWTPVFEEELYQIVESNPS